MEEFIMTKVAVISTDGRIAGNVIKELVARGYDTNRWTDESPSNIIMFA